MLNHKISLLNQWKTMAGVTLACICLSWTLGGLHAASAETENEQELTEVEVQALKLSVPSGWTQEKPSSSMRLSQFRIPSADGDNEDAELAIFSFGGGGNRAANVRRWIGQFQADSESRVTTGKSPQGEYVLVDVRGTYNRPIGPPIQRKTKPVPNSRMLAVVLTLEGKANYFLKLTGPSNTVTENLDSFRHSFGASSAGDEEETTVDQLGP